MRQKKFFIPVFILLFSLLLLASALTSRVSAADSDFSFSYEPQQETWSSSESGLQTVQITSVGVTGNSQITSEYILNVADTKVGQPLSRDMIQADIEEIYNQGYFSYVDVDIRPEGGGVAVMFNVQENPVIESINFSGNTIYKSEQLMTEVFSQVGTVFNRAFFRNDLDRIQEKYHKDGYVMVRVSDVQIQGGDIYVTILEPTINNIIIQGNRKTKTYVISREIKLKKGDIFNATKFRHQLSRLQGLGYFEDVNVNFDIPEDSDGIVDLILTVKEKRTASVGVNVAYGSESGLSGGLTYSDGNLFGRGINFEVGFNEGDEASYWATISSPYMDTKTYAWRLGARYYTYDDRYYYRQGNKQFEFDEKSWQVFGGVGKKFSDSWSWFLTLRHQHTEYSDVHNAIPGYIDDLTKWEGNNQTVELAVTYDRRDEYSPYPKGFVWDTFLEQAVKLGGDYDYLKYWTQARIYLPLNKVVENFADNDFNWSDENPLLFAARLRIGSATETHLPAFARYSLGGMNTLRGYNSRSFEGSNMYLGNFEIRFPINQMFTLVGFYDIGNSDEKMDWKNYHDDYGIGVRVKTPFGNLRVDYAHGEEENKTHFGFGEMF